MIDSITQYILNENVKLEKFHEEYFDSLPADKKEMFYNPERGLYHILILNKDKVGIAGVILNPKRKEFGFFQIYIDKRYRGKGILKEAAKLIFKKYKLKSLIATIKKYNKASIKGHLKAGFVPVEDIEQADMIERGYQKKDEIRLIYRG
jgi:RimJ/RimL family protein N-acetyltransferase